MRLPVAFQHIWKLLGKLKSDSHDFAEREKIGHVLCGMAVRETPSQVGLSDSFGFRNEVNDLFLPPPSNEATALELYRRWGAQ